MKSLCMPLALLLLASTPRCIRDSGRKIPDGVYREPSKIEALTVQGDRIEFQIRVLNERLPGIATREYRYKVLTNDELRFRASSNDTVFVEGVLRYGWLWDGKNIVRKKYKSV